MTDFNRSYPSMLDAFIGEACFTLDYARDRMLHCLSQLDDQQVWSRPRQEMNAVGSIVLHVCGNLRQWIVAGVSGEEDVRDRPAEFAEREVIPVRELMAKLRGTVEDAKAAIREQTTEQLLRSRFIQVSQTTGVGAIWHSVAHLEGHAQEVIYATRLLLGTAYRFKDVY